MNNICNEKDKSTMDHVITTHLEWPECRYYGRLHVLVGPCDQQVAEGGGHQYGVHQSVGSL